MKKIAILTLFGEWNFGNRLQNYAVQEVLKKLQFDVETIKYIGLSDVMPRSETKMDRSRLEKFKEFNENVKFCTKTLYKEIDVDDNFHKNFDYFVIGSDQIWNFTYSKLISDKVFATFAPKNKRISYAASFGVNYALDKNNDFYDIYVNGVNEMNKISVRENAGKNIIKELTGRDDVTVLIDPTMMLTNEEWQKVMKKPVNLTTDKFILKSFLGDYSVLGEIELEKIAKENNCQIIDISNPKSQFWNVGPAEFLWLEKNAFLVATDSFHSSVFAILFSTPLVIFKRDDLVEADMYSRIETLIKTFNIEDRIFNNKITNKMLSKDFGKINEILEIEKNKANRFLKEALNKE